MQSPESCALRRQVWAGARPSHRRLHCSSTVRCGWPGGDRDQRTRWDDSSSRLHISRKVTRILFPRIVLGAGSESAARMLPGLPLVVPMKPELGEQSGDVAWLLLAELDPDPFADHLGQVGSQSGNSVGSCFWGKGWMARRNEGEYPWWIFDRGSNAASRPLPRKPAGRVGSFVVCHR